MRFLKPLVLSLIILASLVTGGCADDTGQSQLPGQGQLKKAPEFPGDLQWLNTDHPLSLKELRGKIVLLDFWTYSCINCIHIMPDLKKLERKFKDELVIIGVHSAKHLTEQQTDNIREAILRYDLEHPVVNDHEFEIWKAYDVHAWPTLVLIGPEGHIIGKRSGENIYQPFSRSISALIDRYGDKIDRTPMHFTLEKNKAPDTYLKFPGKVTADSASRRLFISDSNHNRIVISDLQGQIQDVIGSGQAGQRDGSFGQAQFSNPQGTALRDSLLYIADTDNHLIRKANLKTRKVTTIAGTGTQVYNLHPGGKAADTGLNSPWDLTIAGNTLYIAMAGQHQIWKIDLDTGDIAVHAGTGREGLKAGPLQSAWLAQPSGITTDGNKLYFVDSEASAVQSAGLDAAGLVRTIIGAGLFDFGDRDGGHDVALLQHPIGITKVRDKLYIADTYNNKIKEIDPRKRTSHTYAGFGDEGSKNGPSNEALFDEPGGISYARGKLYVADTNNDLVRTVDMATGRVSTLNLSGMGRIAKTQGISVDPDGFRGPVVDAGQTNLEQLSAIDVQLTLPAGFKINPLAHSQLTLFTRDGSFQKTVDLKDTGFRVPLSGPVEADTLYAEMALYYCREDNEGLCYIKDILFRIHQEAGNGGKAVKLKYEVTNPSGGGS